MKPFAISLSLAACLALLLGLASPAAAASMAPQSRSMLLRNKHTRHYVENQPVGRIWGKDVPLQCVPGRAI